MPNYCNYEMKIVGKKENVGKIVSYLQAEYNYNYDWEKEIYKFSKCTADKHFFRVFEADLLDTEDDYDVKNKLIAVTVNGSCAWSVYCCMFKGEYTYYSNPKSKYDIFKGTNMEDVTKELDLKVEIFSEEFGNNFMEHYLIDKGNILINECKDFETKYDKEEDVYVIASGGLDWDYQI